MKRTLAILILLFAVFWSFSDQSPSVELNDVNLKKIHFSINNALYHLKNISKKTHQPGTNEHKVVQNYLRNELKKLGLETTLQIETVFNEKSKVGTTVENIITKIKGTTNGRSLLLLSHYDSNLHSSLGASDAGSGVVTILEGVRAFLAKNKTPKNDIIIVFTDAEELGLLGAQAFVKSHPFAKNIGLVLNFEARGSGGPSYMLMETNGKNSALLTEFLKSKPNYAVANSLMYSIYKMLPNDTDLTVFRESANINGFNFAFIDDHFDYHTAQDTYERMDRASLAHQADYLTTSLNYFSNVSLDNLNSNEDFVYVNFPFMRLLTYSFSWILPMLVIAMIVFLSLLFFGIKSFKITVNGLLKGFIPFLASLILCGGISFGLWKLLLILHPQYQDILHGFTYNGHQYIVAFVLLNIWLLFKVYSYFKKVTVVDLLIAPMSIWLVLNILIFKYLQGAGFFIVPVFIGLLVLSVLLFTKLKKNNLPILLAILSVPTVYIFAPLIKMFPVGLGLKNLFISAIFVVLLFGMLLPVLLKENKKTRFQTFFGILVIIVFTVASFNSDFSVDKKRPNSLIYIQNQDDEKAYFGTYDVNFDSYTKQIFTKDYICGGIANLKTDSKYKTKFKYHKRTNNRGVLFSKITTDLDTIIGDDRFIEFTITPQRDVAKFKIFNTKPIITKDLCVNGAYVSKNELLNLGEENVFSYAMANTDTELKVSLNIAKNDTLSFIISEISNDLLVNPKFSLQPRTETMMPKPFVTNDAIICFKTLNL